jgi:carbonic anhydrase/acetyltransferase-like protein (isoleucine patch superfamily)
MNNKKYELIPSDKRNLFRIKALKAFSDVKKGDLGGYVESEDNLSQQGTCWVYGDAQVHSNARVLDDAWIYGDAYVYGDAKVHGNAWVYDNARVYGHAQVYGDAKVYGNAKVHDNARVYCHAQVYGDAKVYGNAKVHDNARVLGNAWASGNTNVYGDAYVYGYAQVYGDAYVYGDAKVHGNARVYGDAKVYGNAWVYGEGVIFGNAKVHGDAVVSEYQHVSFSTCTVDLSKDLLSSLRCQLGVYASDDKTVTLYKHVNNDLSSLHDTQFKYKLGVNKVKKYESSNRSCATGLHVSLPTYWENRGGTVLLKCLVKLDDILAVQMGKVRCKKLKVVQIIKKNVF